jgi:hypothetical protein
MGVSAYEQAGDGNDLAHAGEAQVCGREWQLNLSAELSFPFSECTHKPHSQTSPSFITLVTSHDALLLARASAQPATHTHSSMMHRHRHRLATSLALALALLVLVSRAVGESCRKVCVCSRSCAGCVGEG